MARNHPAWIHPSCVTFTLRDVRSLSEAFARE